MTQLSPMSPQLLSSRLSRRAAFALAAGTAISTVGRPAAAQEATPTTQSATVPVNGIDLYYEEVGSGPPLLLLPGLGANGSYWGSLMPALSPHFRCIAMDNRGAGRSAAPSGPYTIRMLADDAAGLLDHLGIEQAHVVGFSLGASIAQELALGHPERIDHLVLLGATAHANPTLFLPWIDVFVQAYERELDPAGFSLWLMAWLFSPAFMTQPDLVAAVMTALATDPHRATPQGLVAQADAARAHDTLDRLGQITAPTLVLVGAQDILFPVAVAQELADGIPGAKLQALDPGAHAFSVENPQATAAALLDFLST